jgi:hypothetical protein
MITFDKPKNLNGIQLIKELKAASITVTDDPEIDGNGNFRLAVSEADKAATAAIVAAHDGITTTPELSVTEKLASVGLSINDLKIALGL